MASQDSMSRAAKAVLGAGSAILQVRLCHAAPQASTCTVKHTCNCMASPAAPRCLQVAPHMAGAIDVIVVRQPDGSLKSTPWYLRLGKYSGLRSVDKRVRIILNGAAHVLVPCNPAFCMHAASFMRELLQACPKAMHAMASLPHGHADVEAGFYMQLGRSGEAFFLREDAEGDAYADGALAGFSSEDDEVRSLRHVLSSCMR